MELFSVICTTCNSKLKVRERAVIGQILACPKCQGMVLVQPPADWVDPGGAPAAPAPVAAATAKAAHDSSPKAVEKKPQPAAPAKPSASNFEDAAALLSKPGSGTASAPPVHAAKPSPAPAEQPIPAPSAEWVSPQTRAVRRWALIGGLATIGIVGLIALLAYAFSGNDNAIAANTDPEPDPSVVAPVEELPAESTDKKIKPEEKPQPKLEATEVTPAPIEKPVEKPVDKPEPMPKPMVDPLAAPEIADPAAKPETSPKALDTFGSTLDKFGEFIEERPAAPANPMPMPQPMPAENAAAPDEEPLPRPDRRKIDVARRMNDPIEAIEMADVPLADFLQFIVDMTAVPVTLDPTALAAVKASPESKVTVSLKNIKVGDLLTKALEPLGLAYEAGESGVVVAPAAVFKGELREIKHDLGDLAKTESDTKVLAEIIHAVIDPDSWDDAGGSGTLKVDGTTLGVVQTPRVQFATIVLCEKLRLARKLPTRSNYPAAVLMLTPRAAAADALLDTPATMNFVPPTRLGRVSEYIKRTAGLRVLVDWQAISAAGWTPEGEVKCGVANQPVSAFLDRLARRMEITWRVLDPATVQLTTSEALAASPDVEVYPVAATDGAELISRLEKELGITAGVLRYDSTGHALIARLPQPMQRKLMAALAK